jgi:outer membrane protein OmpA-like peptidoglycan-associated protein
LGEVNNAQRLSAPFKIMKLAKLAYLPSVGLILALTVVGCKKGLDKTTNIPGQKPGAPTDTVSQPRDATSREVLPPTNPIPPTPTTDTTSITSTDTGKPIAQADGDRFRDWKENREEFAAQTVYFDFDKSNVKPGEVGKLEEVARRMKSDFQGKALRIEGHCDERGTEEYNRALGDRRALSVREKLAALGLDPQMLPTITFGEEKPADAGHTEAAWAKNRRAELILLSPP